MKKGFTLIELMIVIIIIGVLATIGIIQYQAAVEKSRGAEARAVIGYLRSQCASIWMNEGVTTGCTDAALNLGAAAGNIQGTVACAQDTQWFWYDQGAPAGNAVTFLATRCIGAGNGKNPPATVAGTVQLTVDYNAGTDVWATTSGY